MLRQLDEEIKQLISGGVEVLEVATAEELLNNLLYYLLPLEASSPKINHIYHKYDLANASLVPETDSDSSEIQPIDSSAMHAVVDAILQELSDIKKQLTKCQDFTSFITNVSVVHVSLHRVADTLAILGVGNLRQHMLEQMQYLESLRELNASDFSGQKVLPVVDVITNIEQQIEAALIGIQAEPEVSERQFSQDEEFALQECRNGLEEAKDAVVHYIATQWNIKNIKPVPGLLRKVSENLEFLSLEAPANVLKSCANYIQMQLISQSDAPKWDQLDSLADVIASIDYFLEVLSLTKEEDVEILQSAKKGLINLGVPAARAEQIVSGKGDIEEKSLPAEQPSADNADTASQVEDDDALDAETEAEIIEIFVEEAEEVQDTIREHLSQWKNNLTDDDALVEVRRSFHTLKGSGRLVKAYDIGELS